jgi:mono/diheme cytochrome c family protein
MYFVGTIGRKGHRRSIGGRKEWGHVVNFRAYRLVAFLGCSLPLMSWVDAQEPTRARVFTAEQSKSGEARFEALCSACHQSDLRGQDEAPELAGPAFVKRWQKRSTRDLLHFIQTAMPPNSPGAAGDTSNVAIVAFILRANGAQAGHEPLTARTDQPISSILGEQP